MKESMNHKNMVMVKRFDNEMEAEMALQLLKSNKIESLILRDDPAGMGLNRGAKLMVLSKDYKKAVKLLNIKSL